MSYWLIIYIRLLYIVYNRFNIRLFKWSYHIILHSLLYWSFI
nr:MAG TPA: hypothetical protein [Caudoviricetes sp.]